MQNLGLGAFQSQNDPRTVNHVPTMAGFFSTGGVDYAPSDVENQHGVGICTGISFIQEREKVVGRKYSPDFQYLLQKKFYDLNWTEGSSILNALKVGKKYGFLPMELWTYTTESDRNLPYAQYIAKLQAIPDTEIQRLIGLCVNKIAGYAQVDANDPMAIARAINGSKAGVICRFEVGKEWFTPSWRPADINPLKPPVQIIAGHAIVMSKFDYTSSVNQVLANTWGTDWCKQGLADIVWSNYRPTEVWVVTEKEFFVKDLSIGMTDPDVIRLQKFLNSHGAPVNQSGPGSVGNETSYFGSLTQLALIKFQSANGIKPAAGYFGIITRTFVNAMP